MTGSEAVDLSAYREPLEVARGLVRLGVPLFTAESRGAGRFYYPQGWERTLADETVVDRWRPGMALCAVTGVVFDVIDVDPRNAGLQSYQPVHDVMGHSVGRSWTASEGWHDWIMALGLRKKTGLLPGIDFQGGAPDGLGRGFVFIPPTIRPSKLTGELREYYWEAIPGIGTPGTSNDGLKTLIESARSGLGSRDNGSSDYTDPDLDHLVNGGIPPGEHQDPILRDAVWKMVGQGMSDAVIRQLWWIIVQRTPPQDPGWPWSDVDLDRHLDSAREKRGMPMDAGTALRLLPTTGDETPEDHPSPSAMDVPDWYRELYENDPAMQRRAIQRRFDQETDRINRLDIDERERRRSSAVVKEVEVLDGETFIFKEIIEIESYWGRGETVLWPKDEGLMIAGPQGIGKTTIEQNLLLRRVGIGQGALYGFPIDVDEDEDHLYLYLAMDRPAQARRSIRRMVADNPVDREIVSNRLRFWAGPLPINPLARPETLLDWATAYCGRVPAAIFCDSYKDLAVGLSKDDVGASLNLMVQRLIIEGCQWVGAHHHRKRSGEARSTVPQTLDDVYGSTWLTSGLGSVLMAWGEPGAQAIELHQLKEPSEKMLPLHLVHDPGSGWLGVDEDEQMEPVTIIGRRGELGITVRELAVELFGGHSRNDLTRARQTIRRLTGGSAPLVHEVPDGAVVPTGQGGRPAQRYRLAEHDLPVSGPSAEGLRDAYGEG